MGCTKLAFTDSLDLIQSTQLLNLKPPTLFHQLLVSPHLCEHGFGVRELPSLIQRMASEMDSQLQINCLFFFLTVLAVPVLIHVDCTTMSYDAKDTVPSFDFLETNSSIALLADGINLFPPLLLNGLHPANFG